MAAVIHIVSEEHGNNIVFEHSRSVQVWHWSAPAAIRGGKSQRMMITSVNVKSNAEVFCLSVKAENSSFYF